MKTTSIPLFALLTLGSVLSLAASAYRVDWYTIDAGGGVSRGETFELSGTIGQADATEASLTGGPYQVAGGFWPGWLFPEPAEPPTLTIEQDGATVLIMWSPDSPGFFLEQTSDLSSPVWSPVPVGNPIVLPMSDLATFYRLRN